MLRLTRRLLTAVGLAAILPASMAWSQDAPPVRVRGTIERIESPVFLVKSRDGAELKIVLAGPIVAIVSGGNIDLKTFFREQRSWPGVCDRLDNKAYSSDTYDMTRVSTARYFRFFFYPTMRAEEGTRAI
jgi:hypothetical protein